MSPDILLNQNAILKAIHSVYCLEYASEYEEAGPDQLRELAREQLKSEGITPREYGEEE